jgi:hypothetical protein
MKLFRINIMPWWVKVLLIIAIFWLGIALVNKTISNVKTRITHAHEDYKAIQASDSLKTLLLGKCVNLSDSLLQKTANLDEKIKSDSLMFRDINQANQKTMLKLSKQNAEYKKNGACFVWERERFLGKRKLVEISCDSLIRK